MLLLFFCFIFCTLAKRFPLRTSFISENKKVSWGEIGWIGKVGHSGHAVFGQKMLNIQHSVGRCACKSPIMNEQMCWKSLPKNIHWSRTQPLTTMPASALIQMGSYLTCLVGEACYKEPTLHRTFLRSFFGGPPCINKTQKNLVPNYGMFIKQFKNQKFKIIWVFSRTFFKLDGTDKYLECSLSPLFSKKRLVQCRKTQRGTLLRDFT